MTVNGDLRIFSTEILDYLKTLRTADTSSLLDLILFKNVWLFCLSYNILALKPQNIKVEKTSEITFNLTLI